MLSINSWACNGWSGIPGNMHQVSADTLINMCVVFVYCPHPSVTYVRTVQLLTGSSPVPGEWVESKTLLDPIKHPVHAQLLFMAENIVKIVHSFRHKGESIGCGRSLWVNARWICKLLQPEIAFAIRNTDTS